MVGGGKTDNEASDDEDRGIGDGGKNTGGSGAKDDGRESLNDGKDVSGARFDENEPDGVSSYEQEMNR